MDGRLVEGTVTGTRFRKWTEDLDSQPHTNKKTSDHEFIKTSDYPSDESPLDPEVIQLVKDRNRAAGLCDACQELFVSICKIGPDHEGGRALDPFGNDTYKETAFTRWVKGYKPTLIYFPHRTISALTASAKRGCGTCRVLLESLNVYRNPKYYEPISEWFIAARRQKDVRSKWDIWLHQTSNDKQGEEQAEGYSLNLMPTSRIDLSHPSSGQESLDDRLPLYSPEIPHHSQEALVLAKFWLNNCEGNHKSCNQSRALEPSFRPTRLLSVGDTLPRLCLTSVIPRTESLRYAALSHCWGSLDDLIRLNKANIIDFQREIPPAALCKTFRHAIETTRALGLPFLWIDSLCIIQDDDDDWTAEASLMCEVYSCCTVSIAASSSMDGNGGCFFSRDPERRWVQRVELVRDNVPTEFVLLLNRGIRKQCIEDTPLSTRAWALQEHVLAPRTLHFSSSQIYWECQEKEACETLPRGFPGNYRGSNMKTGLTWDVIVQDYSSRILTYPGDKLPAVAGLAQKTYEETKMTYVAGLWLETLAWDLLWNTRAFIYRYHKPKYSNGPLHLAPSWSWAAVDTPIEMPGVKESYPIIDMTDHAFILDVEGLPSGKAAFGHIHRAALIIECEILIPVQSHGGPTEEREPAPFRYTRVHDTAPFAFRPSIDYNNVKNGVKFLLALHTRIERIDHRVVRSSGYALSEPVNSRIIVGGLILEQTGLGRGEYRRIGTFQPDFKSEKEVQNWVKVPKTFTPDLKETDYIKRYFDEKTRNERCTIKII
ncbi:HET-domain-containing protein [Stipitochalara longipes BDJ]|nr:HET-domain-containing protein [Stipitochalara longipes BDJ]